MKVYRMEHKRVRRGPFWINDGSYEDRFCAKWWTKYNKMNADLNDRMDIIRAHPVPRNDFDGIYDRCERKADGHLRGMFGCLSEDKIKHWFGGVLTELHELGFVINVYEVKDADVKIGKSKTQVYFNRRKSKLVETIRIFP